MRLDVSRTPHEPTSPSVRRCMIPHPGLTFYSSLSHTAPFHSSSLEALPNESLLHKCSSQAPFLREPKPGVTASILQPCLPIYSVLIPNPRLRTALESFRMLLEHVPYALPTTMSPIAQGREARLRELSTLPQVSLTGRAGARRTRICPSSTGVASHQLIVDGATTIIQN